MKNIEDDIFSEKYQNEPRIDCYGWKNDLSMVACDDETSDQWIKDIMAKLYA